MQEYFRNLSENIFALLNTHEVLLLNFEGEQSDFVRLNKNQIRQAGKQLQNVREQIGKAVAFWEGLTADFHANARLKLP